MNVKDNTKVRFNELEGGDIFTTKFCGEDELCMKLKQEIQIADENCKSAYHRVNAILLLTGEPIFVSDEYADIRHQNVTLEIN